MKIEINKVIPPPPPETEYVLRLTEVEARVVKRALVYMHDGGALESYAFGREETFQTAQRLVCALLEHQPKWPSY